MASVCRGECGVDAGAARPWQPEPTHTSSVKSARPAAIGRSKNASKLPSDLIIEVTKFSSSIVPQHDAQDGGRDREAVLLHAAKPSSAEGQHDANAEERSC